MVDSCVRKLRGRLGRFAGGPGELPPLHCSTSAFTPYQFVSTRFTMLDQDITVPEPSTSSSSQIISIDPSHTTTAAEAFGSSGVVGVEANNNNNKRRNKTGKKNARPSWSCVECSRRKVRCSKVIPCEGCIKRGQAATCRLEEEDPESAM